MSLDGYDIREESSTVVGKEDCPKCGKDNAKRYVDGHLFCFTAGCAYREPPTHAAEAKPREPAAGFGSHRDTSALIPTDYSVTTDLAKRGLVFATLKRFGVFLADYQRERVQVYPYHDQMGELANQKLRTSDKTFPVLKANPAPPMGECRLFGHNVFGDRYDRQVVVTEGELDAMTVAQCTDFKLAVVSVGLGAGSAAKHLKANYLWLDRFAEIILWFDDDEAGKIATEECAKLFKVGKVRIAKAPGFKDASDVLQAGKPGDVKTAIYMAEAWKPKGIVNAADNADDVTAPTDADHAFKFNWPWDEVTEFLGPILPGQVCYHVAGTGIGKSTGVSEIVVDLLKQGATVAYFGFEDTRRDTKLRIMGTVFSQRFDINPSPDDDMRAKHAEVFGHRRLFLFDPETAEWTTEAVMSYARYCAKALGAQILVWDPLSFIIAGLSLAADERRALDMVSRDLAATAKELGVHMQVTHHLTRPDGLAHEEGAQTSLNQVRGSGGIANFATFVIGHERNQQAAEAADSLLTQLRALKNRPRSRTGPMVTLAYDLHTGRLLPTPRPFPKSGGKSDKRGSGFAPVQAGDDY
jgi:twinkle protein